MVFLRKILVYDSADRNWRRKANHRCGNLGRLTAQYVCTMPTSTLYLWQPQDFNLCEQRNTLVFSGTSNSACKAKGQDEKQRCLR